MRTEQGTGSREQAGHHAAPARSHRRVGENDVVETAPEYWRWTSHHEEDLEDIEAERGTAHLKVLGYGLSP